MASLPRLDRQPLNVTEVRIPSRYRQAVLESRGSYPDVVLGDRPALLQ